MALTAGHVLAARVNEGVEGTEREEALGVPTLPNDGLITIIHYSIEMRATNNRIPPQTLTATGEPGD